MNKIIEHFIMMKEQSEKSLTRPGDPGRNEMSEWHRGLYSGERQAYGHCIEYLRRHLTSHSSRAAGACADWACGSRLKPPPA